MRDADKVLSILYDRGGGAVSLAELSALTGLGQERLLSAVDELRQRGQSIDESPSQGLNLATPAGLDSFLIERDLCTRRVGRNVICFSETGSTNDVAFDSARQDSSDGLAVLAESQRAGRGRLGRKWVSPPRSNILLSILLNNEGGALAHDGLTIAAGVATAAAIAEVCDIKCDLKWPNDVQLEGAKVAGILVEVRNVVLPAGGPKPTDAAKSAGAAKASDSRSAQFIVIGIGVNVNAAPPPDAVVRPAMSLADYLGHSVERIELVRAMLRHLDQWVVRIAAQDYDDLHDAWMARCGIINQRMSILCEGQTHTGRVLDVSPLEGLILCRDDGGTVCLPARSSTVVE